MTDAKLDTDKLVAAANSGLEQAGAHLVTTVDGVMQSISNLPTRK